MTDEHNMMKKELITRNFSKSARSYDSHSSVQKKCAAILAELIGGDAGYRHILEVGCGTGAFTRVLVERWQEAAVTAVDISADMLEVAKERVNKGSVNFTLADAESLELEERPDLITSNASFQWFEDIDRSFKLFHERLSPGGVLCFSMYGPETFRELKQVLSGHYRARRWLSSSRFIPMDRLNSIIGRYFPGAMIREEYFTEHFYTLMDFLKDIKHSGTRGEGLGGSVFLGKYAVREMEEDYVRKFGRIIATHQVFFCRAVKDDA